MNGKLSKRIVAASLAGALALGIMGGGTFLASIADSGLVAYAKPAPADTTATVGSYTIKVTKGAVVGEAGTSTRVNTIATSSEAVTWDTGWYVVTGTVTISGKPTINGNVNLILADDAKLIVNSHIVNTNYSTDTLTIWGQSKGNGEITVTSSAPGQPAFNFGLIINGGKVVANGLSETSKDGTKAVDSPNLIVNGGELTANGGNGDGSNNGSGSGIGGKNITINGGKVVATGGTGTNSASSAIGIQCSGDINITGGEITVTGGENKQAIYAYGSGSVINIANGATVNAGEDASHASNQTLSTGETWKDKLSPASNAPKYVSITATTTTKTIELANDDIMYIFNKDGTYTSNVAGDESGTYQKFNLHNSSGATIKFYGIEREDLPNNISSSNITPEIVATLCGDKEGVKATYSAKNHTITFSKFAYTLTEATATMTGITLDNEKLTSDDAKEIANTNIPDLTKEDMVIYAADSDQGKYKSITYYTMTGTDSPQ